jgi:hypothetical protein
MDDKTLTKLIDSDLPRVALITERVREVTKQQARRFRGGVRVAAGMFSTEKEFREYRESILRQPLP